MPFLGHNPYDGLDVSPDSAAPAASRTADESSRARATVHRFAQDATDEAMLLELLGLHEADTPV